MSKLSKYQSGFFWRQLANEAPKYGERILVRSVFNGKAMLTVATLESTDRNGHNFKDLYGKKVFGMATDWISEADLLPKMEVEETTDALPAIPQDNLPINQPVALEGK
jgi:hypothetical protein